MLTKITLPIHDFDHNKLLKPIDRKTNDHNTLIIHYFQSIVKRINLGIPVK